jgi:2',3'-cyclic-nucleotide 2'-phosphodiesterase (5'-nucleotidase family)
MSVALVVTLCAAQVQLEPITLSIIHFNDFHARFEPITANGGSCKPGDNEQGTSNKFD